MFKVKRIKEVKILEAATTDGEFPLPEKERSLSRSPNGMFRNGIFTPRLFPPSTPPMKELDDGQKFMLFDADEDGTQLMASEMDMG